MPPKNWRVFKANSKNLSDRLDTLTSVWKNFYVRQILPGAMPGTYLIVMMRTQITKGTPNLKIHEPSRRNIAS